MRGATRLAVLAIAGAALSLRCATAVPPAGRYQLAAFEPEERVTLDDLRKGRALYVAKCGGCHGLYAPAHGGAAEWRGWIHDMAPRARIDGAAERKILLYLRGAVVEPPSPTP